MKHILRSSLLTALLTGGILLQAQEVEKIPDVYSRISYDEEGNLILTTRDETFHAASGIPQYSLKQLYGKPVGTENGLIMDFGALEGTLTYGLIPYGKAKHPCP